MPLLDVRSGIELPGVPWKTILNHHRKIFQGILERNPENAETAMKEHLAFVVREFKRKFFDR